MPKSPTQLNIGYSQFAERRDGDRLPVDPVLFFSALCLLGIGLVMMTSASIGAADNNFGNPFHYAERQILFIGLGCIVAYFVWKIPLATWDTLRPILLLTGLLLLAIVLIPGVGQTVNGATRWIRLGSINFQISEIIKVFVIIFLSGYLNKHKEMIATSTRVVFIPVVILLIVAALLLLEPDFGATVVVFATGLSLMLLAGVRLRLFVFLTSLVAVGFSLLAYYSPYRMERLTAFMDPWADPFDTGFQLSQSLIAFGRGEWVGVGLGESVQKLFYLPEAHTDFVLAVVAEELGLIGALIVIVLFTLIAWRALNIGQALQQKERNFEAFIAYGVGCLLVFQAYVNIGVNMGVLPTKGLTLPLMSYGGSSMIMSMFAVGLLMRADYELRFQFAEKKKERRASC